MSILETRAPALPKVSALPYIVFARIVSAASAVLEVFSEALDQAHKARQRYPFSE
jgi:hypothetical protein